MMTDLPDRTVVVGFDFSTGSIKGLAVDARGNKLAEIRLPTDLWTHGGVSELNVMQVEGQVYAAMRAMAHQLRQINRIDDWQAIGISATHHTSTRIDHRHNQVRRAICWNDQTLSVYHEKGVERLGGNDRVRDLIGGPWAARYSLTHLLKDEAELPPEQWRQTAWVVSHGSLVAGYLTGRFDVISTSSAASTGLLDLRSNNWRLEMLQAIETPEYRKLAEKNLPRLIEATEPIGPVADHVAFAAGLTTRPVVFPTNDDQQAGLIGGGAVVNGAIAVILGNSAVVNSSNDEPPRSDCLDAMRLNWGPYLWMRCYNNGAQFLDHVIGPQANWPELEAAAVQTPPGCSKFSVLPFLLPEPSLAIRQPNIEWSPSEPHSAGVRYRASLEALAYLVAMGVQTHEAEGQHISRVVVSGGIARSGLMCSILASVLDRSVDVLESQEGPALGAAISASWALVNHRHMQLGIAERYEIRQAVEEMVHYGPSVMPRSDWVKPYADGLRDFQRRLAVRSNSPTST